MKYHRFFLYYKKYFEGDTNYGRKDTGDNHP